MRRITREKQRDDTNGSVRPKEAHENEKAFGKGSLRIELDQNIPLLYEGSFAEGYIDDPYNAQASTTSTPFSGSTTSML